MLKHSLFLNFFNMRSECSCGCDCGECEQCGHAYCECTCDNWAEGDDDDLENEREW